MCELVELQLWKASHDLCVYSSGRARVMEEVNIRQQSYFNTHSNLFITGCVLHDRKVDNLNIYYSLKSQTRRLQSYYKGNFICASRKFHRHNAFLSSRVTNIAGFSGWIAYYLYAVRQWIYSRVNVSDIFTSWTA